MSAPVANGTNGSSSSSSSSHHQGVSLPSDAADRLFQHRLAALMDSPAIKVTLPPPSAEQLQDRLAKLSGPSEPVPDEVELQRRFDRLHGGGGGGSISNATTGFAPVPLYSASDIALAGHSSHQRSEAEEIEELVEQARLHAELERAHEQAAARNKANGTTSTAAPSSSVKSQPQASSSVSRTAAGISTRAPISSPSPPVPTAAEINDLLHELQSLPDTEILAQAHRMTEAHGQRAGRPKQQTKQQGTSKPKKRSGDSGSESDQTSVSEEEASAKESDSGDDSEDEDTQVNNIIRQAQDEARMGL